jgi:hypothetical protein
MKLTLKQTIKLLRRMMNLSGRRVLAQSLFLWLATIIVPSVLSMSVSAQEGQVLQPRKGRLVGTVTDVNGDTVPGAVVVLVSPENIGRTVVTTDKGFFEFDAVEPAVRYHVKINATGFTEWISPVVVLDPGQFKILTDIQLQIPMERTTVQVTYSPEMVATEQIKAEEKQRILGIIPNFYVVYDPDPAPLSAKLKFKLALRVATDPVTAAGILVLSGAQQAGDTPNYGQGAAGFGKRVGANAADGFSDIMIGGAILPSLLHQDPRYFYKGTGTTKSRIRYALLHPFVCKADNGTWQPNYSTLGGDLASSAISNAYYPNSNRGAGLVFTNFAIATAERAAASLAQEFLLRRLTHQGR